MDFDVPKAVGLKIPALDLVVIGWTFWTGTEAGTDKATDGMGLDWGAGWVDCIGKTDWTDVDAGKADWTDEDVGKAN